MKTQKTVISIVPLKIENKKTNKLILGLQHQSVEVMLTHLDR